MKKKKKERLLWILGLVRDSNLDVLEKELDEDEILLTKQGSKINGIIGSMRREYFTDQLPHKQPKFDPFKSIKKLSRLIKKAY